MGGDNKMSEVWGIDARWKALKDAVADGTQCELMFKDYLGEYTLEPCFFHEDGHWYLIDPPTRIEAKPICWRAI